jgi:hypothetical protein
LEIRKNNKTSTVDFHIDVKGASESSSEFASRVFKTLGLTLYRVMAKLEDKTRYEGEVAAIERPHHHISDDAFE